MAGCSDKRFENLLYAYELGLLSDEDREAVELHLLECEPCFERVKQFRAAARLIQTDPVIRQAIRHMDGEAAGHESNRSPDIQKPAKSKPWSIGVKAALAAAAVLLLFILQPWKIEIGPKQEAIASENLLVIVRLNNVSDPGDPRRLGDIVANLLITDLSESHYIQVVSSQRLYDLRKLLGLDGLAGLDEGAASKVAKKAGARWLLTGSILQTEPAYVVTSQLIDVSSGNVISAQKIAGDSGMTVFSLTDSLSAKIRNDLPPTKTAAVEPNPLVANLTTHSQEAFRYYLEGTDYYYRAYYAEAVKSFEKALEYDSTFAMVYYYLANLKDYGLLAKAAAYSGRATQKERYYIEGLQARRAGDTSLALSIYQKLIDYYPQEKQAYYAMASLKFNLGKYDEAIVRLNNAIALDPLFENAYILLAYSYGRLGNLDQALAINDKSIVLAPNEPNPYDSRGQILTKFKMYDRAIASFKKAIEKKSDFYAAWRNLGSVYTYAGDFIRAESCFQVIASVADIYVWTDGKVYLAQNLIYQGKFQKALAVLAEGSREDGKAHGSEIYSTYHHYAALIYEQLGDVKHTLAEIAKAREIARRTYPDKKIYWRRYYVRILAQAGDIAGAREISEELKASLVEANKKLGDYWYSLGALEAAKGNLAAAAASFTKATVETDAFDYDAHYLLGRTLLELGRSDDAIDQFNLLLADQLAQPEDWAVWEAEVYYYLGLAYQKSGRRPEAIANLTEYLDRRKNCDAQIESILDARTRRAALIAESTS